VRRAITAAGVLVLAVLPAIGAADPASTAALAPITASADAFVLAGTPNANRGGATALRVRAAEKVSYVRFDVPSFPAGETATSAVLTIRATSGSKCPQGVEVLRAASDAWGERTITWENQPGPSGGALDSATWTAAGPQGFDVTTAVTGAGAVTFLLRHAADCSPSGDAVLQSRESSAGPQLSVETGTGSPPPAAACADGVDNDGDGAIDHPADPGCADPADTDEIDPSQPPPGAVVAAAAGDIACDPASSSFGGADPLVCQHRATAALLVGADVVLPLGDLQYPVATLERFLQSYDPSWGQHAARSYPTPGNHEYDDPGAKGYFDYWASEGRPTGGPANGYYSFDLGAWHVISLNSNCSSVPCREGTPQNDFLEADLAATTEPCILATWHHPYFNSGVEHGAVASSGVRAFLEDLYAARADVVLNGHEHNYQRYAKQTPAGAPAADGIREFVVGTGGRGHYALLDAKDPNFEVGFTGRFGVLKLHLGAGAYSWEFVSTSGEILDGGGPVACN
jgi:acid phosphatase type 7